MVGLKTQEGDKFERFFAVIQEEAEKQGAVFFAYAGDGREFETEWLEGEDMMGWLIPKRLSAEFEYLWKNERIEDEWTEYFLWAIWLEENGEITIRFEQ